MALADELAVVAACAPPQLRALWSRTTGRLLPQISTKLLRLALAWEIQAKALGGPSRALQQRLDQLANGKTLTSPARPGMRLVREWNGEVHVVSVADDGTVRWQDKDWRSLSEVARAITGTRWSGPAFFGLKKRVAA